MKAKTHRAKSVHVLGLMTGTSCDAIDGACVALTADGGHGFRTRLKWFESVPLSPALRKKIFEIQNSKARVSLDGVRNLDAELGSVLAGGARTLLERARKKSKPLPEILAIHGFTLLHRPQEGLTWQAGSLIRVAVETGLTVVGNFREGDVVSGAQGAPLVPGFHQTLAANLPHYQSGVAIHNLGGYSNLTYMAPERKTLAFDSGPANAWIDAAAVHATRGRFAFDRDGIMASRGVIHLPTVEQLLKHPYFQKSPPKSTGRDDLSPEWFLKLAKAAQLNGPNLVATATAAVVESIARAYEKFLIGKKAPLAAIYLCGGGARNRFLWKSLAQRMPRIKVLRIEDFGMDPQSIEAQAFAWMGLQALQGEPVAGPWTGPKRKGSWPAPGVIIPGENWAEVVSAISRR